MEKDSNKKKGDEIWLKKNMKDEIIYIYIT